MIEIYKETIPIFLISELNNTDHHFRKYRRKQILQNAVKLYLNAFKWVLPCEIELSRLAPRTLDEDNLVGAFKSVRDQIAQMALGGKKGQKDSDSRISWHYKQEKVARHLAGFKIRIFVDAAQLANTESAKTLLHFSDASELKHLFH